jgi:hypothetical protein
MMVHRTRNDGSRIVPGKRMNVRHRKNGKRRAIRRQQDDMDESPEHGAMVCPEM